MTSPLRLRGQISRVSYVGPSSQGYIVRCHSLSGLLAGPTSADMPRPALCTLFEAERSHGTRRFFFGLQLGRPPHVINSGSLRRHASTPFFFDLFFFFYCWLIASSSCPLVCSPFPSSLQPPPPSSTRRLEPNLLCANQHRSAPA